MSFGPFKVVSTQLLRYVLENALEKRLRKPVHQETGDRRTYSLKEDC